MYRHNVYQRAAWDRFTTSAMRFCKKCNSELWGLWGQEYYYEGGQGELTNKFLRELATMVKMERCPVCGAVLPPKTYYFDKLTHNSEVRKRFEKYAGKSASHLVELNSTKCYPIETIAQMNPTLQIPHPSSRGDLDISDMLHTPDGVAVGFVRFHSTKAEVFFWGKSGVAAESWDIARFVTKNRQEINKAQAKEKLQKFIKKCENVAAPKDRYNLQNAEQLKTVLSYLVSIERDIYAQTERLKVLYEKEDLADKDAWRTQQLGTRDFVKKEEKIRKDIEKLQSIDPTKGINKRSIPVSFPSAPSAPQKPEEPILKKPSLFNKKRILLENMESTALYEQACKQYDKESAEYERKLAAHNEKILQLKSIQNRQYNELLEQAKIKHQEQILELEMQLKELENGSGAACNVITPQVVVLQSIKSETQQAEALLKKLYAARKRIYMSGIIFEKYHNFTAISSFYEYLSSGRCYSLDGANGAYSIYENEVRMNTVISQLSQVIEHLQAIERNQYVLYSAITDANKQISKLNSEMETMNTTLNKMKKSTENIEQNAKVIAYNSAVSAYYSKKNAELTDALGYLIALT